MQVDWAQAFRDNHFRLTLLATRIVGPLEAEDAVQQAFLYALRADSFEGRSQLSTWLHRIVVNTCYMMLRAKMRDPDNFVSELPEQLSNEPNPLEIVRDAQLLMKVNQLLANMNEDMQSVVALRSEGYEFHEIASMHGTEISTEKSRYRRAIVYLKELVN